MSQEVKGKGFALGLGLVSLALAVAGGLFGLRGALTGGPPSPVELGSVLVPLVLLAIALELSASTVGNFGYVYLGFFVAFYTICRPPSLAGPDLATSGVEGQLTLLGQGLLVGFIGMLVHLLQPSTSWTHRLSFLGINMLRLLLGGGVYIFIRGSQNVWSAIGLGAAVAAYALLVLFDKVVVSLVVDQVEEAGDQRIWAHAYKRSWWLLALPVFQGVLAAGASVAALASSSAVGAVVFGAGLAATLSPYVRMALKSAADDRVIQDLEQLELHNRTAQHMLRTLNEEKDALQNELNKKGAEVELIYEMARELGATTNLQDTVSVVQKMIRRLRIPYQSCVVFLLRDNGSLYPALADTPYKEVLEMSPLLQLQEKLITQVIQEHRAHMVSEMNSSSEQRIFKDERSVVCVPLIVSKEIVGVVYLGSINAKTHREEHLEKLKMLAVYAAPSIKTALLFEDMEKALSSERTLRLTVEAKRDQLAGLQKMGQAIGASLKIDNTLKVVVDSLTQMVESAQSVIFFFSSPDDPHSLRCYMAHSPYSDYVKTLPVRNDEGLLGKATESNTTLLVPDTHVYDVHNIIAYERSVIVAPLVAEDEVMGCLYVGASKEKVFEEEHRSLVETVSYQASIAIKNARLYEQTQQMALTDGLTGLYTHRHFQVRLAEEIEWSERSGKPIVLVMVDTDHFKSFNDTLGHPAGDALLKEIAALLKDKVRSTDIVCRYGGDEFALILRDAPKDQAMMTCERIREAFQLRFATSQVQVTSSIGMACFPADARNKQELAVAADDALYVSKRGGRNRVTAAPTLEEKSKPGYEEVKQEPISR